MRSRFRLIYVALALVLVFVVAGLITRLSSRLDENRRDHVLARQQAMHKATRIYWKILMECEAASGAPLEVAIRTALAEEVPLISLEQALRAKWITSEDYQFLKIHGAVFHPFNWTSMLPETVVMELSNGEWLIAKNGSSGW